MFGMKQDWNSTGSAGWGILCVVVGFFALALFIWAVADELEV